MLGAWGLLWIIVGRVLVHIRRGQISGGWLYRNKAEGMANLAFSVVYRSCDIIITSTVPVAPPTNQL